MAPGNLGPYVLRWDDSMPDTDDLSLIVLKGHLLVEEMLSELLAILFHFPQHLEGLHSSFHLKASIVRAACQYDENNKAWDLITALNKTRNELIHNLEPPKLEKVLTTLFSVHKQVDVIDVPVDRNQEHLAEASQRLKWAIQDCMRFLVKLKSSIEENG